MIRKTISLTTFITFLLLLLSSIILYIVPEGRVAYWSDWTILGLSKSQWSNLHITIGVLFLIVGFWHLILNWKSIVNYIRKGATQVKIKPMPIILAIIINVFIFIGTILGWQPMQQVLTWNAQIKAYQARVNGNPPYGHAELSSLESFCGFLGFDKNIVLDNLKTHGLKGDLSLETTILDIAKANNSTPQEIYDLICESMATATPRQLPASPPQGIGQMSLLQLSSTYNLDLSKVIEGLKNRGFETEADQSLKDIASNYKLSPGEVYEMIRELTAKTGAE